MIIKDKNINDKMIAEIGKFTVLWSLFEKNNDNYITIDKLPVIAASITHINAETVKNLATALQGRVDILASGIEEYIGYNLIPGGARPMSDDNKAKMGLFIGSNGQQSLVGGLIAVYRIRNNLLHGLKELTELNGQIELFRAMNALLEEIA